MYAGRRNEDEIPTFFAGWFWGAYLMTIAPFCKELASEELAKLTNSKGAKLSSDLTSRRMKFVTVLHVYTLGLKIERFQRSHVDGDGKQR